MFIKISNFFNIRYAFRLRCTFHAVFYVNFRSEINMNIILIVLFVVPVAYCNYADHNSTSVYMSKQEREKLK